MTKDFSIIIPTRNRIDYLEQAIDSICAQNLDSFEIIIVDDNSTDDTAERIKNNKNKKNIKYYRNENSLFAHGSREKGYHNISGKYVVFMDDDDFYIDNTFFNNALKQFKKHDNLSAVIGGTVEYYDGVLKDYISLNCNGLIKNKEFVNGFGSKYKKPMSSLTMIIKKEALDKVQFDNCKMVNDTCIYLYGMACGDIYVIDKPVAAYRVHSNNISNKKAKFSFIRDNLFEKKKIYKMIKKRHIIDEPKEWYYNQLSPTIYYFIYTSGNNISIIMYISFWMLLFGGNIRLLFIKRSIQKLKKKG